jgi:hypothetical protein
MEEELVYFEQESDDWYYADLYNKLEEDEDE